LLYGIAHGWEWEKTGRLAATLGTLKIASRGGQNHALTRDGIAARYHEAFGTYPW
jgi:adenosine kinase